MGKYGYKIKNFQAGSIYEKMTGVREIYDSKDAMLTNSLFLDYIKTLPEFETINDESTRDIICIEFGYGSRTYEQEKKHLEKLIRDTEKDTKRTEDKKAARLERLHELLLQCETNKEKYDKKTAAEIRKIFYNEGVTIEYKHVNKFKKETFTYINYKMLYRTPGKAKKGSCMFIKDSLYEKARNFLYMGIQLPEKNAPIVEIGAYSSLATSTIIDKIQILPEEILIVKDVDSFFKTKVVSVELDKNHRCQAKTLDEYTVKNTLFDGQALIDYSIFPSWGNGYMLLRQHFFKAAAFCTHIQKFFKDYCDEHGIDYETYQITDMFGINHYAKDIKMITTENATKIIKFCDVIGDGNKKKTYNYWRRRVKADGNIWGIVKTDHQSKLGNVQQMSYQMINTLPCSKEDVRKICQTSIDYVECLKKDDQLFADFLKANATEVNHYEMLRALYEWNPEITKTKLWRFDKSKIISNYVMKLRKGKIFVNGDNLTVCGNPYALLLHSVGEDWNGDPTFSQEDDCIQVYTKRFSDGEYLCGIRSPHNGMQNMAYFKNHYHPLFEKYFDFSNNIMVVNCIHTDVQARMNGEDSIDQGRL